MQIRRKEVTIFADDMILYAENPFKNAFPSDKSISVQ